MVARSNTVGVNGNIAFSQYSFLKPGYTRDPGDIPTGWNFEFRAGIDEYQKMHKGILLRIRKSSTKTAMVQFFTYAGNKYLGGPSSLAEAVSLAMGPKYAQKHKLNRESPPDAPGMDVAEQAPETPEMSGT